MDTHDAIVISIAIMIPLLGFLVEILLGTARLRGYWNIGRDVRLLRKLIHGKICRDGSNVLLCGNMGRWPVSVRFSRSDQKPELNIRMSVPSGITLYCLPRNREDQVGRASLRSTDPNFATRFRLSTNHPLEARIVFSPGATLREIEKLCSSSSTLLVLQDRTLELSELVLPKENLYRQALGRIHRMARIAEALAQMPGSKAVPRFARQWNWFRTAYCGVLLLLMLSALVLAPAHKVASAPTVSLPVEIPEAELAQIEDIQRWRLMQPDDFAPGALSWMRQQGWSVTGRLALTREGRNAVAYLLKPVDQTTGSSFRLVMFADGKLRFDTIFPEVGIAARVPQDAIRNVDWGGPAPQGEPDSDGVLIVRRLNQPESSTVFFFSGLRLLSGRPKDYQYFSLK